MDPIDLKPGQRVVIALADNAAAYNEKREPVKERIFKGAVVSQAQAGVFINLDDYGADSPFYAPWDSLQDCAVVPNEPTLTTCGE